MTIEWIAKVSWKIEKARSFKAISMIALIGDIMWLSLGSAALIIILGAEIKLTGTIFNVDFSSVPDSVVTNVIKPSVNFINVVATVAEIDK